MDLFKNASNELRVDKRDYIANKVSELKELIRKLDQAYYIDAEPLVSDREYDKLFLELNELEKQNPEFITEDSPTQRVGGEPLKSFTQVIHSKPMLSLANTYGREEVIDFNRRVKENLGTGNYKYVAELKFDGVATSLLYDKGKLAVAATRGNWDNG